MLSAVASEAAPIAPREAIVVGEATTIAFGRGGTTASSAGDRAVVVGLAVDRSVAQAIVAQGEPLVRWISGGDCYVEMKSSRKS